MAIGTTSKMAKQFVHDKKISFTVLADSNQFVGRAYGIKNIPEAFVIDPDGIIQLQSTTTGQILWNLLEGKEIPVFFTLKVSIACNGVKTKSLVSRLLTRL